MKVTNRIKTACYMYNVSIASQDWSIDQRVKILVVSQFNLMHVSPTSVEHAGSVE